MRAILTAVLLLLAACREPEPAAIERRPPPVATAPVTTDRTHYQMSEGPYGPETTIATTFTAPADRPVYLVNCNGAFTIGLQQRVGSEWRDVWASEINACFSAPIVIPAGTRRTGTITVASGADAAVSSRRTERKIGSGTYRAVWHGLLATFDPNAHPADGDPLPLTQRVSAPFTIEAAPPRDLTRTTPPSRPAEIASVEPAHASRVAADAPVRIHFTRAPVGPQLYIDGEPVEAGRVRQRSAVELELMQRWRAGRHEVRVVYQDEARRTRWYAWTFMVTGE